MINLIQLTHTVTPYTGSSIYGLGIKLYARVYSSTQAFTDLILKVSKAKIVSREVGVEGYINLSIPTSFLDSEELLVRADGRIEIKIVNVSIDGIETTVQIFDADIDDFRFDISPDKATYTLVLRSDFSSPVKGAVIQNNFISKIKLAYTGVEERYVYSVDPVDYRRYSIGASFAEGLLSGVIDEIDFTLVPRKMILTIGVLV